MPFTVKAQKAIDMINQQIGELKEIISQLETEIILDVALEKLGRWKERTVKLIDKLIDPSEATKLKNKRMTSYSMIDPISNIIEEIKMYLAFLTSLMEKIDKYPEDIFSAPLGAETIRNIMMTREGVYFAGQHFDALQLVRDIFSEA